MVLGKNLEKNDPAVAFHGELKSRMVPAAAFCLQDDSPTIAGKRHVKVGVYGLKHSVKRRINHGASDIAVRNSKNGVIDFIFQICQRGLLLEQHMRKHFSKIRLFHNGTLRSTSP